MLAVSVRVRATVLAGVVFVGALVNSLVLLPLAGRVDPTWLGFALGVACLLIAVGGPLLVLLRMTGHGRRSPAWLDLHLDGTVFTVPATLRYQGFVAALAMEAAGLAAGMAMPADTVVAVVLAFVGLAFIWLVRYTVTLTPTGVVVTATRGRWEVLWSQLLAGGPMPPGRLAPTMRLHYRAPGGRPKVFCLSLLFLQVDRVFLATVMRHYAEQPQHRTDIGTPAELDRLKAGFAAWRGQSAVEPAAVR